MISNKKLSRGQAMVEFIIVIPVLILLIFGTIQIGFIYSAKTTLNYATFQAARLAAVNHATYSSMRRGLIRGLAPLYTSSKDLSRVYEDVNEGSDSDGNKRDAQSEVDGYTRIIRLNPTSLVFSDGADGYGVENADGIIEIPNDSLMFRPNNAGSGEINLQDANLLKIRVQYCYKLMVPIVNRIIGSLSELNNTRPASDYHRYDTVTDPRFADHNRGMVDDGASLTPVTATYDELCGGHGDVEDRAEGSTGFIISSEVIVRMQSTAYESDDDEDFEAIMCNDIHMACP